MSILHYVGHPFVDVGVATITAFANKKYPQAVIEADLTETSKFLKQIYTQPDYKLVQNLISSVFLNSHFVQAAKTLEQKESYADEVLFAWRDGEALQDTQCIFFPEKPAVLFAHRQHIPLLNGKDIGNFSSNGIAGLPISGEALIAIHAMPLGCLKTGNLLAFHQLGNPTDSQSGIMNVVLAKRALTENLKAVADMPRDPTTTIPSFGSAVRSRYVDEIIRAKDEIAIRDGVIDTSFVTGYYFTNYGPSPRLEIIQLEQAIFDFVDEARQSAGAIWWSVEYAGWTKPRDENAEPNDKNTRYWRNEMYEALFKLPGYARVFLKRFLFKTDWILVEIFLRKVLQMEYERIEIYRRIGDRLGEYMVAYEAPSNSFYIQFSRAKHYTTLRNLIRKAEDRQLKANVGEPIILFDEFILAFEHPSDGYRQWKLARDLIGMRLREAIYANPHKFNVSEIESLGEDEIEEED